MVKGYYKQSGLEYTPEETVIDVVRKYSEIATLSDGKHYTYTHNSFQNFFSIFLSQHSSKQAKWWRKKKTLSCNNIDEKSQFSHS